MMVSIVNGRPRLGACVPNYGASFDFLGFWVAAKEPASNYAIQIEYNSSPHYGIYTYNIYIYYYIIYIITLYARCLCAAPRKWTALSSSPPPTAWCLPKVSSPTVGLPYSRGLFFEGSLKTEGCQGILACHGSDPLPLCSERLCMALL